MGKYWTPTGSYECLTQEKVYAKLSELAILAVGNYFTANPISSYEASQALADTREARIVFKGLVTAIIRDNLDPLISNDTFFKNWWLV